MNTKIILTILCVGAIIAGVIIKFHTSTVPENTQSTQTEKQATTTAASTTPVQNTTKPSSELVAPITNADKRITKKFFGTFVTPANSPVQPERFTGYHTGVDFETFPEEQQTDVAINTICSGKLLQKGRASGYGGYAVQACIISGQNVTVVYGHLRQSSIAPAVGTTLNGGDHLAVLGTGYSSETDGERKHLHLSIHIGTTINIKGYVQNKADLSAWLDAKELLNL